jgi:hypothetical protein
MIDCGFRLVLRHAGTRSKDEAPARDAVVRAGAVMGFGAHYVWKGRPPRRDHITASLPLVYPERHSAMQNGLGTAGEAVLCDGPKL